MREINNFDELFDIQNELYDHAVSLDLLFIRDSYNIVDGIVLVIGPDCHEYLEMFYIKNVTLASFTDGQLGYIELHYKTDLSYYKKYRYIYIR